MKVDKNQDRTYSVEPYNPEWITKFEATKRFLESVFGEQAIMIEHVGSTAIPNMKAKPVIDVLLSWVRCNSLQTKKRKWVQSDMSG